jgi:hypothetical protein
MAVPHYTYLVLKMPGPRGIITVKGSFKLSDLCDKELHKMVQNFGMIDNYGEPKGKIASTAVANYKTAQRISSGARSKETVGTVIGPNGNCSRGEDLCNIDNKRTKSG